MNIVDRLLEHNAWATRVVLERCRSLTPEQFGRRFEMGLGSLHDTLLHTIGAMIRWSDRIAGRTVRPSIEADTSTRTPDQLLAELDRAAMEIGAVARSMREAKRLDEIMESKFGDSPPIHFTRGTAIVHVMTHGAHHRAQALNMLRQLGIAPKDLPDIDAIEWELTAAPGGAAARHS
jgi:uncharacterized damage-inducible protein DinB